MSQCTVEPV
jgi:hypothetical protein